MTFDTARRWHLPQDLEPCPGCHKAFIAPEHEQCLRCEAQGKGRVDNETASTVRPPGGFLCRRIGSGFGTRMWDPEPER